MSFALTAVLEKSVTVEEWIAVPVEIETPDVLIEFVTVGIAVPVATFHNFTVAVPVSSAKFHALIVHAKGTGRYFVTPLLKADPLPSKVKPIARIFCGARDVQLSALPDASTPSG